MFSFITSQQMRELAGAVVGPGTALKTARRTETHKHMDMKVSMLAIQVFLFTTLAKNKK